MRHRSKARQIALQVLYQVDLCGKDSLQSSQDFIEGSASDPLVREYARNLIDGCITNWDELNTKITETAKNWSLGRMAVLDRTILRIAIYEMLHQGDVPAKVVINEAIELGKRFSTNHSGAFINGILDKLLS